MRVEWLLLQGRTGHSEGNKRQGVIIACLESIVVEVFVTGPFPVLDGATRCLPGRHYFLSVAGDAFLVCPFTGGWVGACSEPRPAFPCPSFHVGSSKE